MALAHIKTDDFWANSALFQCAGTGLQHHAMDGNVQWRSIAKTLGAINNSHIFDTHGSQVRRRQSAAKTDRARAHIIPKAMGVLGRRWAVLTVLPG